ncbi:FitA-like ribbon-helix-helix domain-containing protein [Nocardia lasii]|uniref:Antitoxin FitA-like ribbon-helix-helix domain-containing protein n=1 Tax=Nocardia lasii TaxID=1616107 RepID=A0ABW1JKE5_9NOCA
MTAVTIRDVPEDVLVAVKKHATQAGQSLPAYLLDLLRRDAADVCTDRSPDVPGETRGERAIRRARGRITTPETRGLSTDQLMNPAGYSRLE